MFNRNLIRVSRKIVRLLGAEPGRPTKADFLKEIYEPQKGNDIIRESLLNSKPFFASRLGNSELGVLENYFEIQKLKGLNFFHSFINQSKGIDPFWRPQVKKNIGFNAGFFPTTDSMLEKFATEFLTDLKQVDLLGIWYYRFEDIIANKWCEDASLVEPTSLEPYYHSAPWSSVLAGKKVLVIHPFAASIQAQFAKRKMIFRDSTILPDFDLQVIKAIQTSAGSGTNFNSWFDALNYMADQISKCDFHVAIIGAGAYGLPLGAIVKRMGKQAIHVGGATQILFGIMGARWNNIPRISSMYNQHWVRPDESERPPLFEKLENGCYW